MLNINQPTPRYICKQVMWSHMTYPRVMFDLVNNNNDQCVTLTIIVLSSTPLAQNWGSYVWLIWMYFTKSVITPSVLLQKLCFWKLTDRAIMTHTCPCSLNHCRFPNPCWSLIFIIQLLLARPWLQSWSIRVISGFCSQGPVQSELFCS